MKATLRHTATLAVVFAGTLPAADSRLVGLVMPDATVIAGVNVTQAKTSPFGQYVLSLVAPDDPRLLALTAATGFDPRKDVTDLLAATGGGGPAGGLVLARGTFPLEAITAAAWAAGAAQETYQDVTILKSPDGLQALAFLDSTLAVFGGPDSVKAAIGRRSPDARRLSSAVISRIGQVSAANDAWVLTTVPPAGLHPPSAAPAVPGLNLQALQQIRQAALAVKFGANVRVAAQAQIDTAQNAATLAGMLQLVANMAQMQAQKNPAAAEFAKSVGIAADGSTVEVTFSIPEAQLQQLIETRQRGREMAPQPAGHKPL